MNPWQKIFGYLAIVAITFYGGWHVRGWKDTAALKVSDDALLAAQDKAARDGQAASQTYEAERQQQARTITDLQKKVRAAHAAHPNTNCMLDSDGVQYIGEAIASSAR